MVLRIWGSSYLGPATLPMLSIIWIFSLTVMVIFKGWHSRGCKVLLLSHESIIWQCHHFSLIVINKIDVPKTRVAIQQLFRTPVVVQWKGSLVSVGIIYLMGKLIVQNSENQLYNSWEQIRQPPPKSYTYKDHVPEVMFNIVIPLIYASIA
jgi:hypothetical protein